MFKLNILVLIFISFYSNTLSIHIGRQFNFKPANVAPRDAQSEKVKMVIDMATIVWNRKNDNLASYFRITNVLNATEQLDTSGLYNFYVTFTRTECLKADIKDWQSIESSASKNCLLTSQSFMCPIRVLYQPWRSVDLPITLIKPMEAKNQDNSVCFLPIY